jgi:hypothetical protein
MARKKSQRRNKKSKGSAASLFGVFGALVILAALISGGVFLFLKSETQYSLNQDDLCPVDGARGTVAILLDTTDKLSDVTKSEILQKTDETLDTLPRYYRLAVYTMDENGLNKSPISSVCNPGKLEQMGQLERDGFTANPKLIKDRYSQFSAIVKDATTQLFQQNFEAEQSPLLSSMQSLSFELPKPTSMDQHKYKAGKNKIIFVTDLMEHTETFSIYRSGVSFDQFKKSRATEKYGKKFGDIDLDFWTVRRNISNFSTRELQEFWAKILTQEFRSDVNRMITLSGEI